MSFKKFLSNETLVHSVMIAFAFASVFNISTYLNTHEHGIAFSYTLGSALGFGLVSISIMLSKTSISDKPTFITMLVTTILFGLLSGTLQTLAYKAHGLNIWLSMLFGYAFPLLMECLLAVAVSLHSTSERKKKLKEFSEGFGDKINEKVAAGVDVDKIEIDNTYLALKIQEVIKAKTDEAIEALMPKSNFKNKPFKIKDNTLKDGALKDDILKDDFKITDPIKDEIANRFNEDNEEEVLNKDIGNSKAPIKIDDKFSIFVHQIENIYNGDIENFDKKEMAETLETSVQTVYNYVKKYKNQKC